MTIGGFRGPSGRRERSAERALSASTLLPTSAFVALGTLTVLLVAQMGMSPLSAVVGPSAHDGGRAVTTPHLSISIGEGRVDPFGAVSSRAKTRVGLTPTVDTVTLDNHEQPDLTTVVSLVALPVALPGSAAEDAAPGSASEGAAVLASRRAHGQSGHAARHMAKHARHSAKHARHAKDFRHSAKHAKRHSASKHVEASQSI